MKTRYIILVLSIIFLSMFFISINAQSLVDPAKLFNLGGVTYSPLIKQTTPNQSIFIAQEGTHKRVTGERINSSINKLTGTPDNYNIPNLSGIPDQSENYPPIYYEDKMYGDVGYVPGTDPEVVYAYAKNNNRSPTTGSTVINIWNTTPLTGTYHIPVLLVDFTDAPHTLSSSVFEDQYNDSWYLDGNGTSVKKYYQKESYGTLNITFDVYDWRRLTAHTNEWYATGNNAFQLILDTMNLYGTGSNAIDFTQYDSDNDGRIDGVVILHAGYSAGQMGAGSIGSQTRIFSQSTQYSIQGKYYGNTAIVNELVKPSFCSNYIDSPISYPSDCRGEVLTEVHEFAHVLGLPDLYARSPTGSQVGAGLGDITMMAEQSGYPQHPINLDAWSRYFLGWINPTTITSTMYGNYSINSIDTNADAAFILQDNSRMNLREYFIVSNRYINQSILNQDKYLFGGINLALYNLNGGLDIYHVDETYIEERYPTNTIMYDSDMNMYNDTVSHPGIVFEQNALNDASNNQSVGFNDLYTTEWAAYYNIPDFGIFDNTERLDPSFGIFWDTTSHTYNGLEDTGVKVQTLSAGGINVIAYLQSSDAPFYAGIVNPINNHSYQKNTAINFSENHMGNDGNVSCIWKKTGGTVISTECSFSATPHSFGIDSTGCLPNTTPITLVETDLGTNEQVTDIVDISVYSSTMTMCETQNNQQASSMD